MRAESSEDLCSSASDLLSENVARCRFFGFTAAFSQRSSVWLHRLILFRPQSAALCPRPPLLLPLLSVVVFNTQGTILHVYESRKPVLHLPRRDKRKTIRVRDNGLCTQDAPAVSQIISPSLSPSLFLCRRYRPRNMTSWADESDDAYLERPPAEYTGGGGGGGGGGSGGGRPRLNLKPRSANAAKSSSGGGSSSIFGSAKPREEGE